MCIICESLLKNKRTEVECVVENKNHEVFKQGTIIFVPESGLMWEVVWVYHPVVDIKRLDNGDMKKVNITNLDYFLLCGMIEIIEH